MAPPPEDAPRASTLLHLRKMMAAAAALGVAAITTRSASGRSETHDVTITPDASHPDTSVALPDASAPDGGVAPSCPGGEVLPNGTCGYMVVDPIPTPAQRGCGCSKTPGSSD